MACLGEESRPLAEGARDRSACARGSQLNLVWQQIRVPLTSCCTKCQLRRCRCCRHLETYSSFVPTRGVKQNTFPGTTRDKARRTARALGCQQTPALSTGILHDTMWRITPATMSTDKRKRFSLRIESPYPFVSPVRWGSYSTGYVHRLRDADAGVMTAVLLRSA